MEPYLAYLAYFNINDLKKVKECVETNDVDKIFEYGPLKGKSDNVLWEAKVFEKYKKVELSLEEGIIQCRKCKGFKVYSYTKQTRSGDESLTTFAFCSLCSAKWRINS